MTDQSVLDQPSTVYLGKHEEEGGRDGNGIVREMGVSPHGFFPIGDSKTIAYLGDYLEIHEGEKARLGKQTIQRESGIHGVVFTRSRRHVFSWLPKPTISSIPDLVTVNSPKVSETLKEFERLYRQRENRAVILTDDLSYLIAVPHNGGSKSEIGHNHSKAICYRFDKDEISTVLIKYGNGDAGIVDAEHLNDGLRFMVYSSDGKPEEWAIVDADSAIDAQFSARPTNQFNHCLPFWDPPNDAIWLVEFDPLMAPASADPVVFKHSLRDGSRIQAKLVGGNLKVPETR